MRYVIILATTAAIALGVRVLAQAPAAPARKSTITSPADYSKTMKEINSIVSAGLKVTPAPPDDPTDPDGLPNPLEGERRLWMLFRDVQAYWEDRNVVDAAGFANAAAAASEEVARTLSIDDTAGFNAAQKTLAAQCQSCHMAHR